MAQKSVHGKRDGIASITSDVDELKLHYLSAGSGPPVILLHAYTQTSRMWGPIILLIARKFTVIARGPMSGACEPDRIPSGKRPRPFRYRAPKDHEIPDR